MVREEELQLHTNRTTKPLEWVGLTIVKAWLSSLVPPVRTTDVHSDPSWFSKGVDLVLSYPDRTETVDLKTDSYYGLDRKRKVKGFYHPDSGVLLLETTSQLRYDRTDLSTHPDVDGWFFTSQASRVFYYYLAIDSAPADVMAIYDRMRALERQGLVSEIFERELLARIQIERDELLSYSLSELRAWFKTAPRDAFEGWAGAGNAPYVTVSRRMKRSYLLEHKLGVSHGSIVGIAKKSGGQHSGLA